jgi:tRNA threonylcarbamoyl adenosine modification protein YeaZ
VRLLLDSSGNELVCALADAAGVIAETRLPSGAAAARDIGAVAGPLLGELRIGDLEAIVVGLGPGSFIGTRVAISFANGLAATGAASLYGVDSLAAIGAVLGSGRSMVLRDARRGEAYCNGPAGDGQGSRLAPLAELADLVRQHSVRTVIIEQPAESAGRGREFLDLAQQAAASAGAQVLLTSGVPAEGLRRLYLHQQPQPYLEPVYLRGFR